MARTVSLKNQYQAKSNPAASGVAQGTPGGIRQAVGSRMGLKMGTEYYLWILVLAEVGIMAFMRKKFRRYHGG